MSKEERKSAGIIPALRYRDGAKAIEWLCAAFGFERYLVVPGPDDTIAHAQLVCDAGMIMLGSADHGEFSKTVRPPENGVCSQCNYVVVEDVDAHYRRAIAAGAEIVLDIKDEDYGGRGYTCRDPEGHVWSFGSYDPWSGEQYDG